VGLSSLLALSACDGWRQGTPNAPVAHKTRAARAEGAHAPIVPIEDARATFLLDGAPFCFAGTNQYYLMYKSKAMVDDAIGVMQRMGIRVMRHWAFIDRGSLDGSVRNVHADGTADGVYFQYWDAKNQRVAYNDGADGLERLDYLMLKAREANIRVILVFTNNWKDFGGMDQYLAWFGLKQHPEFYTDERVKAAYKDYVAHLLNRVNTLTGIAYKDDAHVFAWGLANEPRLRNYTSSDPTSRWDTTAITNWAQEMTSYVRSIDPVHLVSVGDEGMFNNARTPFYDGSDGVDHQALLNLPEVDYGTFHLYPDHWKTGFVKFGDQWIEDHLEAARVAGKPTMLEEYGCRVTRDAQSQAITAGWAKRERVYNQWNTRMLQRGGAASLVWMVSGKDPASKHSQYYADYDGFAVYDPAIDPTGQLVMNYAARFPKEARACTLAADLPPKREVPKGFVTVTTPIRPSN
jgi:endo-1,4-beta-mannosidase